MKNTHTISLAEAEYAVGLRQEGDGWVSAMRQAPVKREEQWQCVGGIGARIEGGLLTYAIGGTEAGAWPGMPVLQFGLEKAGYLQLQQTIEVPGGMVAVAGQDGQGAAAVHAATAIENADRISAHKAVMAALDGALEAQAYSKGLWHQPFFLRYALRMTDGSRIMPSAPVLMLPTMLPPCLQVSVDGRSGDTATLSFPGVSHPLFSLRMRVLQGIRPEWKAAVSAVEIYASECIATYSAKSLPAAFGVQPYRDVAGWHLSSDDRGRERVQEASSIYAGRWSDGGDANADHTLHDTGMENAMAWALAPNAYFMAQLLGKKDFRLIASLPIEEADNSEWRTVSVASTSPLAVSQAPLLDCEAWRPVPATALLVSNGVLHVAGDQDALPALQPLPAMTAACGSECGDGCSVEALVKREGKLVRTVTEWRGVSPVVGGSAVRYLFYPDASAVAITIRQGEMSECYPLTPCHGGACYVNLEAEAAAPANAVSAAGALPMEITLEDGNAECRIGAVPTGAVVHSTEQGKPLGFVSESRCGSGTALTITSTGRECGARSRGMAAVFTTEGIWCIAADAKGRYTTRGLIADHKCVSAAGIACCDGGVAYIHSKPDGITMLKDGKLARLTKEGDMVRASLPGLAEFAQRHGIGAMPSVADMVKGGALAYDDEAGELVLANDAAPGIWLRHSLGQGCWWASCAGSRRVMLVSKPIEVDKGRLVRVRSVEIGMQSEGCGRAAIAVYASADGRRWELAAVTPGVGVRAMAGMACRYVIAAVTAEGPCRISSVYLGGIAAGNG